MHLLMCILTIITEPVPGHRGLLNHARTVPQNPCTVTFHTPTLIKIIPIEDQIDRIFQIKIKLIIPSIAATGGYRVNVLLMFRFSSSIWVFNI